MTSPRTDPDERADALGGERPVERGSFRDRMRRRSHTRIAWRVSIFLAGLLCILAGFALVVLPGPLTIPPIIVGLWIWSTEFAWANRFFAPAREKAKVAWKNAKEHPVSSSLITVGGLVVAGLVIWLVSHFHLVQQVKEYVGLD